MKERVELMHGRILNSLKPKYKNLNFSILKTGIKKIFFVDINLPNEG